MRRLITLVFIFAIGLPFFAGTATNAGDDLKKTAHAALIAYTDATLAGPKSLAPMLAPEFQIMRSNGSGYDRQEYLSRSVGTIKAAPATDYNHEDIVATQHGDLMVVRYTLRIDLVIEGKQIKKRAPRLTVFRKVEGNWKVVAHSNFGATK